MNASFDRSILNSQLMTSLDESEPARDRSMDHVGHRGHIACRCSWADTFRSTVTGEEFPCSVA